MADEKLHTTAADDAAKKSDTSNEDTYGVPMEEVEAVLNATADKATLSPQIQQMMQRQAENRRRVEESIKGTKANASWFVPLFCTLMLIGLFWAVIYYLNPMLPIPGIGSWNLAIALVIVMAGFIMTMWWR
ncbi:cell division protein CrgA [Bifidobacteriaceae bacterium NR002]|nr:cell division protein CrgA [Bifidobacteriaceae bacterium NR002]MDZ7549056.1 cell division protein CrgA [Bifidobacteriaceae bacterium NR047]